MTLKILKNSKIKYYLNTAPSKFFEYLQYRFRLIADNDSEFASYENVEGIREYNFQIPKFIEKKGISAFIRIKNEEKKIERCLNSVIKAFDEIVVIDNQSSDNTLKIVQNFQQAHALGHKVKLAQYPFSVSKCGKEHNDTPENSVHSLAYFYNYSLSHCTFRFVCKWDADMIFDTRFVDTFAEFVASINASFPATWSVTGTTVYKDLNNQYWLSEDEMYSEPRIFPLSYFHCYRKGNNFEVLHSPSLNIKLSFMFGKQPIISRKGFPENIFYELKCLDEDEFSHWSNNCFPTPRKKKEWDKFQRLKLSDYKSDPHLRPLEVHF